MYTFCGRDFFLSARVSFSFFFHPSVCSPHPSVITLQQKRTLRINLIIKNILDRKKEKKEKERTSERERKREKQRNSLYCAYVSCANARERTSNILFHLNSSLYTSVCPIAKERQQEREEKVNCICIFICTLERTWSAR